MSTPHDVALLLLAKAPVPGDVKTRLGAEVGLTVAAELASAALLDTIQVAECAFPTSPKVLALAGDLHAACRADELVEALSGWRIIEQRGVDFGARLAAAHAETFELTGLATVQIGMDTPHLRPKQLSEVAAGLGAADAVLGFAEDGGWWVLGLLDPTKAAVLEKVPMSLPSTGELTLKALRRVTTPVLAGQTYDVDTKAEADRAAADAPDSLFAQCWREKVGAR